MRQENTIESILESINNGTFKRQNNSVITVDKTGQIMFDGILKPNEGIKIINEKQINAFKKKKQKEKDMREHIENNEGCFVHFVYKYMCPIFEEIEQEFKGSKANLHIIRFFQLATYLNSKNKLYDNDNNRIKKGNLGKIWDTKNNRKSVYETYELLKAKGYIYEDKEGYIHMNENIIIRGKVQDFDKKKKEDINITYTRLFSENIQHMYLNTDKKSRKQLANLFKILPYINFTHNTFCLNPYESDIEKLEMCNWTDLARICGYENNKNISKFKSDMFKLKIKDYNVLGEFKTGTGKAIFINPKIYYAGADIEDVKRLYIMFEMCQR